jgi:hypothetical protein
MKTAIILIIPFFLAIIGRTKFPVNHKILTSKKYEMFYSFVNMLTIGMLSFGLIFLISVFAFS